MTTYPSTSSGQMPQQQQQQQNHTIVQMPQQPGSPPLPQQGPPQRNRPCLDLLEGNRKEYIKIGIPLYEAAIKGDWKAAKPILEKQPDLIRFAITDKEETLLHVVASAESTKAVEEFVINLVNLMDKADLELQNTNWDTALSVAAQAGNLEIARALVKKNPALTEIPNKSNVMPLYIAVLFAKNDMVRYLYGISNKMSGHFWSHENRGWVLQNCVKAEMFDVAIKIVNDCPELTDNKWLLMEVLLALAQQPYAFVERKPSVAFRIIKSFNEVFGMSMGPLEKEGEALQLLKLIWGKIAEMPRSDIDDILQGPLVIVEKENNEKECGTLPLLKMLLEKMDTTPKSEIEKENKSDTEKNNKIKTYPSRILFVATKMGNVRFIIELIRLYPDVIWQLDDKGKTIFHLAVKHRQEIVYNLLYEIGAKKDLITHIQDKKGNNMLHMAAKGRKKENFRWVQGVAFQMQRELLWYQEVEVMVPPQYRKSKNGAGETPYDVFTMKHADLVTKGEHWMKETTSQCIVAATLIATITFAAAFTLPGGYKQDTGIPFFRKEPALIVFVISDAISLIASSTSLLIFLSIFLARYAERDFLESLPSKLMSGLATLFLSIATMMVAFGASFFVLYNKKLEWVPVLITTLAGIPIILSALLQNRLLVDVWNSTYRSRYLFKPKRRVLYY